MSQLRSSPPIPGVPPLSSRPLPLAAALLLLILPAATAVRAQPAVPAAPPPQSPASPPHRVRLDPAAHAPASPPTPLRSPPVPGDAVPRGLCQLATLPNTAAGRAALAANYTVTGAVQHGTFHQPTLLPFPQQQQQALRDAFITQYDLAELADGLGTTLGAAFLARAHYLDLHRYTVLSPAVAAVIAYANDTSGPDANQGKFLLANATTDGHTPVAPELAAIFRDLHGTPDVFGRAYRHPAGSPGSDRFGDPRPFQTEPSQAPISGPDYFDHPATAVDYTRGPIQDLTASPSYPSGHTTYGTMGAVLLAVLVPERYGAMIARGAEYGNDRIILGAHYAMDVIAGRTVALYDLAHLLNNDPNYLGRSLKHAPVIHDFRAAIAAARADTVRLLQAACGDTIAACAAQDIGRFADPAALAAFVASTQTYGLPVVHPAIAAAPEDVGRIAPEAGTLLTAAFPRLSLAEADRILTDTEGPGGGFLDDGSAFGLYSRLNLFDAAHRAAAETARPSAP